MNATGVLNKGNSRSEYWRDVIQQQARSGQSVSVFCSERGLTEQSLYYWRKRLHKEGPVSFALVTADRSDSKDGAPLELELGSGQRLRIPRGADPATLRTVLAVLRERS
jgi:transposase-like protein